MMRDQIHTFRAATMDEALELVHRQLGQDFVILESREIPKRRLLPWPAAPMEVEITAEYVAAVGSTSQTVIHSDPAVAQQANRLNSVTAAHPPQPPAFRPTHGLFGTLPELPAELDDASDNRPSSTTAPDSIDSPSDEFSGIATSFTIGSAAHPYQQDLDSLRSIVAQLERLTRPKAMHDLPAELFQHYQQLTSADVEDDIARELILRLSRQSPDRVLNSPAAVTAALTAQIERTVRCTPPITPRSGHREIVTLIGPTGTGKTTTLAKLAGHYHLKSGLRVGLITVDTNRVGAVEQLQSYADILQLPFYSVTSPDELRSAVDELGDTDLILIDTAGISPYDQSKISGLKELVEVSGSNHVLLVLSMVAGSRTLTRIADQFSIASPTSLVLTKIDEVPAGGGLLTVAREIPFPVSYLSTGPEVPDQIEPAHPVRMARLILGRDPTCQNHDPLRVEKS